MKLIFLASTLLLLCACSKSDSLTKHQLYVFGTIVEISIWHEDEKETKQAIDLISIKFNQIHHKWHAWKPGRLHEINKSLQNGEVVELSIEESSFIEETIQLSKQSNHLFNPTIGKLINMWGFHTDEYPILTPPPELSAIQTLVEQSITINDLKLNGNQLSSENRQVWLDFGGVAKGYAIDLAIDILHQSNINDAIINAGGDLRSIGTKGKNNWRVAIQSPKDWTFLAEIQVKHEDAIFTSGNYQRYKEFDGKRYAHIIDPRTGMPVNEIVSATVITDNGVLADAAATALIVAGENWWGVAQNLNIKQALIIDEHHQCFTTGAMFKRLEKLTIECQIID